MLFLLVGIALENPCLRSAAVLAHPPSGTESALNPAPT